MTHDVLDAIISRLEPAVARILEPVIEAVRIEYGGAENYIYSARRQRKKNIRSAAQHQTVQTVAQRYQVSRRTVQRIRSGQ